MEPIRIEIHSDIELALPATKRVEMLKLNGETAGVVPAVYQNGKLSFQINTNCLPGGVMVYYLN